MTLSFWQKDAFSEPADVLIAGAGFAGLWCAYEIKYRYPHLKITVLEKERFPGGASVRNAGFACFGSPGEMLADAASMGEETMWKIVALRYEGIQKLRAILGDETIAYDDCGGFECFTDKMAFQQVAGKLDWLNAGLEKLTGIDAAFTIADDRLAALGLKNFSHLIFNHLEGGLHSGKTIKALLQKVASMGVHVLFGAAVTHWNQVNEKVRVTADTGETITIDATRFIIANNAFTKELAPVFPVRPARGQILLTAPIEGLQLRGTFHFEEGYYYWRNLGNRILLGGARNTSFTAEQTFAQETSAEIQQALENFLYRHLPVPADIKIEERWAGIMGFTQHKQPHIEQLSGGVWATVACNGMGVALAPAIAKQVTDKIFAENVNAGALF